MMLKALEEPLGPWAGCPGWLGVHVLAEKLLPGYQEALKKPPVTSLLASHQIGVPSHVCVRELMCFAV